MGAAVAAALIGAGGAAYSANQASKNKTSYMSLDALMPAELSSIFDDQHRGPASSDPRLHGTALGNSLYELLQQAQFGLPSSVAQRGRSQLAGGYRAGQDNANRMSALGFGPAATGGANWGASAARGIADYDSSIEVLNQQQKTNALMSLLNFFQGMQAVRTGAPVSQTQTQSPNVLGGAALGLNAYAQFGGGGGWGSGGSSGFDRSGNPTSINGQSLVG